MNGDHPVFGIEQARCLALETGDIRSLSPLLSDTLVYVHATGLVHDKPALLAHLQERVQFIEVRRAHLHLVDNGDTVWLTGFMRLVGLRIPGHETFTATSFVTQIWVRHHDGWRLSLFQSTKTSDDLWPAQVGRQL